MLTKAKFFYFFLKDVILTLPADKKDAKIPQIQAFGGFTVPLSLLTTKAALFPPLIDRIPAATQRGCSDALISHTGQHKGQHTRTSLPSFTSLPPASPLYSLLINTPSGLPLNPITLFVRILLNGFSGS